MYHASASAIIARVHEPHRSIYINKTTLWIAMLCIAWTMLCARIYAQTIGTGSVQGTIQDQSGAVVPNAVVTAVDTDTGYTVTQHTSGAGFYTLSSLPPARYKITVNAEGFETLVQDNVSVDALTVVDLNLHLQIGTSSQTVVISSLPPQLDTSNGNLEVTLPNTTYLRSRCPWPAARRTPWDL